MEPRAKQDTVTTPYDDRMAATIDGLFEQVVTDLRSLADDQLADPSQARLLLRSPQTIATGTATGALTNTAGEQATAIAWTIAARDSDRYWRESLGGWLVIPADGLYLVTAQVAWDAPGAGLVALWVCRNRALHQAQQLSAPGAADLTMSVSALLSCVVGDTVQIGVQQRSGAPVDVLAGDDGTHCDIVRVR